MQGDRSDPYRHGCGAEGVSCYMVIPLITYFMEEQKAQKMIYCVLFALTFTVPFYGYFTGVGADFFIFLPIYIMMAYTFLEEWILPLMKKHVSHA